MYTMRSTLSLLYSLCFLAPPIQGARAELNLYPQDEIRLLSEGLLQIGSGLKREFNHTKHQIKSIFQQLHNFNTSLAKLSGQVNQATKLGEQLDQKTRNFEENAKMYEMLAEISDELAKLKEEEASLDNKIKPLENKIQIALDKRNERESLLNASDIMASIERQNMQILSLQAIVDSHQDKINSQEDKIQRLQKKAHSRKTKSKKRRNLGARENSQI
ncbi:angiopoietin-related protein 3-like [Bufo gargarizans]|uniref:angiopoietin-related protein 3-like n=1 Tax=Bufo gargarizans TaxID=30331 RepID=UPI001CF1337C|nr:angiopoietin-related protein 3-like [Bufo gargarizans]